MTTTSEDTVEDLKRRALALSGHVLVRIRVLSQPEAESDAGAAEKLRLIEKLADSAHNLPQLVATFGDNHWASVETLSSECGLCEHTLKQAAQFCSVNRTEKQMNQHPIEQRVDVERERWAEILAIGIRTLRKHGFYVTQDPDAAKQSDDEQKRQSLDAACELLGLPATPGNVQHQVVQSLGRQLLENAAVAAERLRGRS